MTNILVSILFGIVEGITEWMPVSSTGHMILLNELVHFNVSEAFYSMYEVVIQLGAIMAVVVLYFKKIWPFGKTKYPLGKLKFVKSRIFFLWVKIIIACLPAVVIGLTIDDLIEELFYNPICVSLALIVVGVVFLVVENINKGKKPKVTKLSQITYKTAFIIGLFQVVAAIFPGTSRSGATIIGALLLGVSRSVATEFTFFLAIPVMFGASLLKVIKIGLAFSAYEFLLLAIGSIVAFIVSFFVIKFFMGYIRKHDFKVFGIYRIVLGIAVLAYFLIFA